MPTRSKALILSRCEPPAESTAGPCIYERHPCGNPPSPDYQGPSELRQNCPVDPSVNVNAAGSSEATVLQYTRWREGDASCAGFGALQWHGEECHRARSCECNR